MLLVKSTSWSQIVLKHKLLGYKVKKKSPYVNLINIGDVAQDIGITCFVKKLLKYAQFTSLKNA